MTTTLRSGLRRIVRLGWAALGFACVTLLLATPTHAQRRRRRTAAANGVQVRIVEIAGSRVYVEPGEDAGVTRGSQVSFGRQRLRVVAATATHAMLDMANGLEEGMRGTAEASTTDADATVRRRFSPLSAEELSTRWSGERPRPAENQHPRIVPLGSVSPRGRNELLMSATMLTSMPLRGDTASFGYGELRLRLVAQPFREAPLHIDADVALLHYLGNDIASRDGNAARPLLRVRALEVAYGDRASLYGALGRMRYVATGLGMLDGIKLQTPSFGGFTVAAFGGVVPDPLSGKPLLDASRFGVELGFRRPRDATRPDISLVARGSLFDGSIDERRLVASARFYPGRSTFGSQIEAALFDADNPFHAERIEVQNASADAAFSAGPVRVGARVSMHRPERSRWLASFFPQGWFCIAQTTTAPATAPCTGTETRYTAVADVAVTLPSLVLSGGAVALSTNGIGTNGQLGGFIGARVPKLFRVMRVELSLTAQSGPLLESYSGSVGVGAELADGKLDVSARYRPVIRRYASDVSSLQEHGVGLDVLWWPTDDLALTLDGDAIFGDEISALIAQAGVTWRPSW